MTAEKARKEEHPRRHPQSRAEFLPYHLKTTLQHSSQWGAVRVLPAETDSVDLLVKGTILESHGESVEVRIEARDASGKVWFETKRITPKPTSASYAALEPGEKDVFQDLYNRIANDLAEQRHETLAPGGQDAADRLAAGLRRPVRTEAYTGLSEKGARRWALRQPAAAEGDSMMARLSRSASGHTFSWMSSTSSTTASTAGCGRPTKSWRRSNLDEQQARQKIKRDALIRQVGGVLLLAGAIAIGANRGQIGPLEIGMAVIGGQVIWSTGSTSPNRLKCTPNRSGN